MKKAVIRISNRREQKVFSYPWEEKEREECKDLEPSKLEKILREDFKLLFDEVELVGGVMLHPKIEEILRKIKKMKLKSVVVNLEANIGQQKINLKELKERGVTKLAFLMMGDKKENASFLGKNYTEKLEETIKKAREIGLAVKINFLITNKNWQKLPQYIDYFRGNNLEVYWNEIMPWGSAKKRNNLQFDSSKKISLFWQALRNWGEKGFKIFGHSNFLDNFSGCPYKEILYLDQEGNSLKCPYTENNIETKLSSRNCSRCFKKKLQEEKVIKFGLKESASFLRKQIIETIFKNYSLVSEPITENKTELNVSQVSSKILQPENFNLIADCLRRVKLLAGLRVNWIKDYYAFPEILAFNLTEKSNLQYGFSTKLAFGKDLSILEIKQYFRRLSFLGIKRINLTGRDILKYGKLKELLSFLDKNNFEVVVSLDGWNFENNKKFLLDSKIKVFLFDIYGASHELHDKMVGKEESFSRIMDAIEFLLENKKNVGFNYYLANNNWEDLKQILDFSSMLQIRFLNIIPIEESFPQAKKSYFLKKGMLKRIKKEYWEMRKRGGFNLECGLSYPKEERTRVDNFLDYYKEIIK